MDNRKLSLQLENIALKVAQCVDGKYKPVDSQRISVNPAHTLELCSSLISKRSYMDLVDFDNHLDDITLDWKNEVINDELKNEV